MVTKTGITRSVFDLGSHRHNLHTAVTYNSVALPPGHIRPAGIQKHDLDKINNLGSVFLKHIEPDQKLATSLFMHRRHSKSQPYI